MLRRASIYFGSATGLSATANWTAESDQVSAFFGYSVSTAGDVDGDGYSDVIVGTPLYDNGQSNEGRVFVYYGGASGTSAAINWTTESNQVDASIGGCVSTAGDVNGDGYSDVIVGASGYDNGQTNEGRVFVYYGSAGGLSAVADWTAESNQANADFGNSVSTAGDVNGDGYSDVIVAAHAYSNGQTNEGRVFVYYGSASGLSATPDWTAESNQAYADFGTSVSTAGDVNGDGFSDVIVGAYANSNGQSLEGGAFVYLGSASGLSATPEWTAEGDQADACFGRSVSTAGDVNGDGFSDVIVGADRYDNGETDEGRAFVYYGSASGLSLASSWSAESNQAGASFGFSVSTAGDVNGDGFSDVIAGAYGGENGQANEGRAYVYYGSASGLSVAADWTAESNQANAFFGMSVSTAGDVNGDGFSDVIIGALGYDNGQSDEGAAFIYHGSASGLSADANWTAESDQSGAGFGISVASAGDVDGDGYSDVIAGAYGYTNGQGYEGGAFVYYGNGGTGMKSIVQQYRTGTTSVIGPHGKTGADGTVRLSGFARSAFGRSDGKLVYTYAANGASFGSIVNASGEQAAYGDLQTSGIQLNSDVSGIPSGKSYRWRARVKYSPVNTPFQVFGPWKYYTSYQPKSFGSFKAQNTPLPVELHSFAARVSSQDILLSWKTATEVNNLGFEIERKYLNPGQLENIGQWLRAGFVEGCGTSNSPKSYSFIDARPAAGVYAYRLKQIDRDGAFIYSPEVELALGGAPTVFALSQNYPNPFNPATTIAFTVPSTGRAVLKIFNTLGQEVATLFDGEASAGIRHRVQFNASEAASGMYFSRLEFNGSVQLKKMSLIK